MASHPIRSAITRIDELSTRNAPATFRAPPGLRPKARQRCGWGWRGVAARCRLAVRAGLGAAPGLRWARRVPLNGAGILHNRVARTGLSTGDFRAALDVGGHGLNRPMTSHPIRSAITRIDEVLKDVRDVPLWSMGPAETREAMVEVTFAEAQLAELRARVTAHGQTVEVEADSGATSTANWLAIETRQTRAGAHRAAKLATALATQAHEPVRLALADGELLVDQAEVIIAAVDALPEDLDPGTRSRHRAR